MWKARGLITRDKPEESIGQLFGRLSSDVKAFISTQVAVYRIEATRRGTSAGVGVAFFVIALLVLQSALVALLVGLVVLLSLSIGPGLATLVVVGGALLLAVILAFVGLRNVKLAINPDGKK